MSVKVDLQYIEKWNVSLEKAVRAYEAEPIVQDQKKR